jgi:geranylgeranyl pyrophosphate synthase
MLCAYPDILQDVAPDLEAVFAQLYDSLGVVARKIMHQYLPQPELDLLIPPALTLFSGRLFSRPEAARQPAVFLELIQIGSAFHDLKAWGPSASEQLLILAGDYMYSHLFNQLGKDDCLFLLERLASLIACMNEGSTVWEQLGKKIKDVKIDYIIDGLKKQYGIIFGEGCAMGALFSGASSGSEHLLYSFGSELGVAYGLQINGLSQEFGQYWIDSALQQLLDLPDVPARERLATFARSIINDPGSEGTYAVS